MDLVVRDRRVRQPAIAHVNSDLRVREGGEITHRVDTGGDAAVACMLGGPDRRTLFMLTSDTDTERLAKSDSRCRSEIADVEVPGAGLP